MKKITFLGPIDSTFSHEAYNKLSDIFNTPKVNQSNYCEASTNADVIRLIDKHGGWGAIAMATLAEGRVSEPLESFIELLDNYSDSRQLKFNIIGAIKMKLNFCLMTRKDVNKNKLIGVIAHQKALGVCKNNILINKYKTISVNSNGEAARLISCNEEYKNYAAIGPAIASNKFDLKIVNIKFEDKKAVTTFFLIGTKSKKIKTGKHNRALIVFKLQHKSGSLVEALKPFQKENLNLTQIHSMYREEGNYNFAIEIDVKENQLQSFNKALKDFKNKVDKYLCFGPFEVLG